MSKGLPSDVDVLAHYEQGHEIGRLDRGVAALEFERTKEILRRHLPSAGRVADIGGGPGAYAVWLTQQGYNVVHRDLVPLHVQATRDAAARAGVAVDTSVGDARQLDLPASCVEAVLLLGPLYHLPHREDRLAALSEASRIVRPGGVLVVAAISRWAALLDGVVVKRLDVLVDQVDVVERTGVLAPLFDGSFSAYSHRPDELRSEIVDVGLEVVDLVGVEGISFALSDVEERWSDPGARNVLLEAARRVESVPELLGLSPHLVAVARRPR